MLYYRGGIYKFLQLLALLAPTAAWAVAAIYVTVEGVDANNTIPLDEQGGSDTDKVGSLANVLYVRACTCIDRVD
jgi:hypothetical protein